MNYRGRSFVIILSFLIFFFKASAVDLPVRMINGLAHFELRINGQGPFLFGFDTGFGGEMSLDSAFAVKMNLQSRGTMQMGDPSGRNSFMVPVTEVNGVQLGSLQISSSNAIIRSRRPLPGAENVVGIIGMSFFRDYIITLDFPSLVFRIEEGKLPAADGKNIFNYTASGGGVPAIKISLGSEEIMAQLDTRSMTTSFIIPESLVNKLNMLDEPKLVSRARTVSNEVEIKEVRIKESVSFGNYTYTEPAVHFPALTGNAVIGARVLTQYAITIDQKNKRLKLLRSENSPTSSAANGLMVNNEYVGTYGERTVSVDANGFLYVQRPGGRQLKMIKKGADEFSLEMVPAALLKFERDADRKITAIKVLTPEGKWETSKKN